LRLVDLPLGITTGRELARSSALASPCPEDLLLAIPFV
jgi:hypothetical protein